MIHTSRRAFMRSAVATSLFSGASMTNALGAFSASAADTTGYKALVCVFFRGGLDCHDTVLPYDQAEYDRLAEIRQSMFNNYPSRARSALLPLDALNPAAQSGRQFALPPQLAPLHALFEQQRASIVANVGPLLRPLTRDEFDNNRSLAPGNLFSHNDQQSTWVAFQGEGARLGWGGRFADAVLTSGANQGSPFTALSASGQDVFLAGELAQQYQIGSGGVPEIRELDNERFLGSGRNSDIALDLLNQHFRSAGADRANLFERDVVDRYRRSIDGNRLFNQSRDNVMPLTTTFPDDRLGGQLRAVADTIATRSFLNINRQIFLVSLGGFDSHSNQAGSLPERQADFAAAIAAFYNATLELGVENQVTLFTASDFGRTLRVNGDGTDHGWGGHHFVVGGAVDGGKIFGEMPPTDLDHDQDSGNGRLIPTTSVEQYAASLGRWFGLNDGELAAALPGLGNFTAPPAFV